MRADDTTTPVISSSTEHRVDTSTPSDLTHADDSLPIRGSTAGRKKQMLRAGDLIGVHDPFLGITRPAVVLGVDDEDFGGQHLYRVLVTYDNGTTHIEQAPQDFTVASDIGWGTDHARMMQTRASTPSTQHPQHSAPPALSTPSTQHPQHSAPSALSKLSGSR